MEEVEQVRVVLGTIFEIAGNIGMAAAWLLTVGFVALAIMGLIKPAYRFGKAIAWKKVFIVSDSETRHDLRCDLERSGLIKHKNILEKSKGQTGELRGARLLIVDFNYLGADEVLRIVSAKCPDCGVLVYAKPGSIKSDCTEKLNLYQHVSVVNFRGRLVNEVLLLLLSTSFTKNDASKQVI